MATPIEGTSQRPGEEAPLRSVSGERSALVRARSVRFDLHVEDKVVGVISLVIESDGVEKWLLEMDAFGGIQVSAEFTREQDAHSHAEQFALAQQQVEIAVMHMRDRAEVTVR